MSPNDDAITAFIPKSLKAQTACSLEEPLPKLSLANYIFDLS